MRVSNPRNTFVFDPEGVKWYDADGEEHGEVTAHDFVTGLKHAADKKSESLPLVKDSIKGLKDYSEGKNFRFL